MSKCGFDTIQALLEANKSIINYIKANNSFNINDINEILNSIFISFKELYDIPTEELKNEFIKALQNRLNMYATKKFRNPLDVLLFSESNMANTMIDIMAGREVDTSLPATSHDVLTTPIEGKSIKEASDRFLHDAYGSAETVKKEAVLEAKTYLFDALFLDRGLTLNLYLEGTRTVGSSNQNIRNYHLKLFNDIIEYLRGDKSIPPEKFNNTLLYERLGETWVSTGVLNSFLPDIKRNFESFRPDILNDLRESTNHYHKIKLKAYNALVFLLNFDNFVKSIFGDSIKINHFGSRIGEDKYFLKQKTGKITDSYRKDENIDVESEMDSVVKLMIETTQLCDRNGNPIKGKYLTFLDFSFLSSFFRLNGTSKEFRDLVFTELMLTRGSKFKNLSGNTRKFILNKSLALIVAALRLDYLSVMPIISELYLAGHLDNLSVFSNLNPDQKLKLNTIMYRYYGNNNSIYKLVDFKDLNHIYRNLCQTADSIFLNILTQCYQDEDGVMYTRLMLDLAEYNQARDIRDKINQANASSLQPSDFVDSFKKKYGFLKEENKQLTFKIPITGTDFNIGIRINKSNEGSDIRIFNDKEQYTLSNINLFKDFNKFVKTVKTLSDLLLKTTFVLEGNYWDNFVSKDDNVTIASTKLLKYISRVLNRIYISNVDLKDKSYETATALLEGIFNEETNKVVGYDRIRSLVNLWGGTSADENIISNLAKAKIESDGLTMAATVSDSTLKQLSMAALSKLVCSYGILQLLLEVLPDSVTKDLDIIKDTSLFKDVSIVNEFYSKKLAKSKKTVEMTPSEFAAMNILTDYIPALFELDSRRLVTNGVALFIASVNSDKNTVDKIAINLNATFIDENGNTVSYKDASLELLKTPLKRNLGGYYSNMLNKIYLDFDLLKEYIPQVFDVDSNISLKLSELSGFDYIHNFAKFKEIVALINSLQGTNLTERLFIEKLTYRYNLEHPKNIILLVQNIHVKYDGSGNLVGASDTILGQVYRFGYNPTITLPNPILSNFFTLEGPTRSWSTLEQFLEMKQLELVGSLLQNETTLNIDTLPKRKNDREPLLVQDLLRQNYKDWIDDSGNLILFKFNGNNISSKEDYIKWNYIILKNYKTHMLEYFGSKKIQINPILLKQNLLHYLFTLQWMFTTVGSFVAHPGKLKLGTLAEQLVSAHSWMKEMFEEAAQFNALAKRNVAFTAQMLLFLLNDLFGVNSHYTVATVEDLHKMIDVLTNKQNDAKPFDGATLVDPFTMLLENKSLAGNGSTGETKKTFVHFKNPQVGNGGIIKTAVFALTNNVMRQSPETALNLFYKMSNKVWKDEQGNILTDFNILQSDLEPGKSLIPDNFFYTKNGRFYQILDITYNGNNIYTRTEIEVDSQGRALTLDVKGYKKWLKYNPRGTFELYSKLIEGRSKPFLSNPISVNSNVQAWELFGGLQSMEIKNGKLVWSENSVKAVVDCMNHKGFVRNGATEIKTLNDFYQPMKHSLTNYIVTEGAIKQGAANVNKNNVYDDNSELLTQIFEMLQGGILLDKEHHADFSEVSVPTLVISACAALGISFYNADSLYNGVATIAEIALDQILKEALVQDMDPESKAKFLDSCMEIVIKNLSTASTQSFGTILALSIVDTVKLVKKGQEEWAKRGLPLSDNTVFAKAVNALANYMTKNAIKLKMPGTLAIMTPSHKMTPIYGDRKWSDYLDPLKEIRTTLWERYDSNPVFDSEKGGTVANVNIDTTYKIDYNEPIKFGFLSPEATLLELGYIPESLRDTVILVIYNGVSYNYNTGLLWNSLYELYNGKQANFGEVPDASNRQAVVLYLYDKAIYESIRLKTLNRRKKLRTETNDEYQIRINQEAFDEFLHVKLLGYRALTYHKKAVLGETDNTNINYYDLREQVESGQVSNITEYIMDGRDLSSYNVRYKDFNGTSFNIWDLKSVQDVHNLKKGTPEYFEAGKQMKRDIKVLSKVSIDSEQKMNEFLQAIDNGENLETIKHNLATYINMLFGIGVLNDISLMDPLQLTAEINRLKEDICGNYVTIKTKDRVYKVKVDRNSIQHLDYEVIMPNTYKTIFGLEEGTCVAEILNNPNYFVNLNILNAGTKLGSNQYNIEIKRSNGLHIYLALDNNFDINGLTDITATVSLTTDEMGVLYRIDENGNNLYEIKPGTKIYVDSNGTEIICINTTTNKDNYVVASDNLKHYLNAFGGSKVLLSESCLNMSEQLQDSVLDTLYESRHDDSFIRAYLNSPETVSLYIEQQNNIRLLTDKLLRQALEAKKKKASDRTKEELENLNFVLRHPDYLDGMERYNTFKEYLKVIAARIPALSMQSFMAMKVVGFSNGDKNTAYVSDHLIFLQGSDFRV